MEKNDYSYFKIIETYCKRRWKNTNILDVLTTEYKKRSKTYFIDAIKSGCILINRERTNCEYVIKEHDKITHIIHFHEPPQPKIMYKNFLIENKEDLCKATNGKSFKEYTLPNIVEILYNGPDFTVVNKPSGCYSHPNANCKYYSLTKTLEPILGSVSCVNRLDVPTSGIVIIANNNNKLHELMKKRQIKKTYVALVKGRFDDQIVDKPIGKNYGVGSVICDDGKESITKFKGIWYNGKYSLVECIPITGRTHQIRVHLQSIGFPIINDILYDGAKIAICRLNNKFNCEPDRAIQQNDNFYLHKTNSLRYTDKCDRTGGKCENNSTIITDINLAEEAKSFAFDNCEYKNNRIYKNKDLFLCLHAYKYEIHGLKFEAELPLWAIFDSFNI